MLPIDVRAGFLILLGLYLVAGVGYLAPGFLEHRVERS
jgi:hypothetical protein